MIERAYDRAYCPGGYKRQAAATMVSAVQLDRLREIRVPSLIVHGSRDSLLPVEHGRQLAALIPGARLVEIAGMGHDLEGGIAARLVDETSRFARRHDSEFEDSILTDQPSAAR